MKHNWDLIRKILLKLEEKPNTTDMLNSTDIPPFDKHTVAYHYKLLSSAGLIEGFDISTIDEFDFYATTLTWQGHEFLDKIRNDSVWNKVKSTIQSKSLDLSFDIIKQVSTSLISSMLP